MKIIILPLLFLSTILYSQYGVLYYYPNSQSLSLMNPSFQKEKSYISNNLTNDIRRYNSQFYNISIKGNNNNRFSMIYLNENENDYNLSGFSTSFQYTKKINENLQIGSEFTFMNNKYGFTYKEIKSKYSQRLGAGITYSNKNLFIGGALKISNKEISYNLPFFVEYNIQAGGHLRLNNIELTPSFIFHKFGLYKYNVLSNLNVKRKWLSLQAAINPAWDQLSYGIAFDIKNIQFGYVLSKYIYSSLALHWNTSHNFHITFQLERCKD